MCGKTDETLEMKLAARLRMCGYFLYYQAGDKAGQGRILTTLLGSGNMTQRELQRIMDMKSGSLSEILAKIEADGFIARVKSDEDRRQVELRLTREGRAAAEEFRKEYRNMATELFEELTEEEENQLLLLLEKLVEKWTNKGGREKE